MKSSVELRPAIFDLGRVQDLQSIIRSVLWRTAQNGATRLIELLPAGPTSGEGEAACLFDYCVQVVRENVAEQR